MRAADRWWADPRLSWGARGLLWEFYTRGGEFSATLDTLFRRGTRDRPGGNADSRDELARWLAELLAAGALTCTRGCYRIPADRELDVMAAKLAGEHARLCDPPLPRGEVRQWQQLIRELIVVASHDPADVSLALSRWRERRRAGARLGRDILLAILEDLELAAAEDDPEFATCCPQCLNVHPPSAACLYWAGPRR